MAIETTVFDPMTYLDTPADHLDLLNEALATGDARVVINIIGQIARGRGIGDVKEATGIGRSTLYKAFAPDGNPTIDTFMSVLSALRIGLKAEMREVA